MKLTIKQLSIIEGCCERNAKALKRNMLNELSIPGTNSISDIEVSYFRSVPLEAIGYSLRFQKPAFIRLKDIMRLFGVQQRQASNIKRLIGCALLKKEKQKISVLEFARYFNIPCIDIYVLMDESIREKGIKRVNELNFKQIDRIKYFYDENDGKKDYVAISEFPEFWEKYKMKISRQPAFDGIIQIYLV